MKFITEKKGETYLVLNDTTKQVRGRHKTEGEAKLHAQTLQKLQDEGMQRASARFTPPSETEDGGR